MKVSISFLWIGLTTFNFFTVKSQIRTTVSDAEIRALGEELLKLDRNNVVNLIGVNLQDKATRDGIDRASQPLLTVPASVYKKPTYKTFVALLDNYIASTTVPEVVTGPETYEEKAFLDVVLQTALMRRLEKFLIDKRFVINRRVNKNGVTQFNKNAMRNALYHIWFDIYPRDNNVNGSCGFEHTFVGEKRGDNVLGFHNWISFARQERLNALNYYGHIRVLRIGNKGMVLKSKFKWNNAPKPVGTMFVGTSPEFELGIYTLCYYVKPGVQCPISLNGKSVPIVTHFIKRQRKRYLSSAYPDI